MDNDDIEQINRALLDGSLMLTQSGLPARPALSEIQQWRANDAPEDRARQERIETRLRQQRHQQERRSVVRFGSNGSRLDRLETANGEDLDVLARQFGIIRHDGQSDDSLRVRLRRALRSSAQGPVDITVLANAISEEFRVWLRRQVEYQNENLSEHLGLLPAASAASLEETLVKARRDLEQRGWAVVSKSHPEIIPAGQENRYYWAEGERRDLFFDLHRFSFLERSSLSHRGQTYVDLMFMFYRIEGLWQSGFQNNFYLGENDVPMMNTTMYERVLLEPRTYIVKCFSLPECFDDLIDTMLQHEQEYSNAVPILVRPEANEYLRRGMRYEYTVMR